MAKLNVSHASCYQLEDECKDQLLSKDNDRSTFLRIILYLKIKQFIYLLTLQRKSLKGISWHHVLEKFQTFNLCPNVFFFGLTLQWYTNSFIIIMAWPSQCIKWTISLFPQLTWHLVHSRSSSVTSCGVNFTQSRKPHLKHKTMGAINFSN